MLFCNVILRTSQYETEERACTGILTAFCLLVVWYVAKATKASNFDCLMDKV